MTHRGLFRIALLAVIATVSGIDGNAAQTSMPAETRARMEFFNRALGVECVHCHTDGKWTDETKAQFGIARNMTRMVLAVNERLVKPDRVSCWTCHRGQVQPSRQPRPLLDAELERWPAELAKAPENLKLTMSVYNVALGVTCDHCHTPDWKSTDKAPMKLVKTMNGLFEIFPPLMPATARTQCFMCHKGSTSPAARPEGRQ